MNNIDNPNWITRLLREHPALMVSFVYVVASTIGMFYSWDFLRQFGINVFNFAQISDFLLASLKEPFTWVLAIIAVTLIAFDNAMSRRVQRKNKYKWLRWYGSDRYRSMNYLTGFLFVLVFLHGYAVVQARETFAGKGQLVEVTAADEDTAKSSLLLGTTGQFLFLFDVQSRQVTIHPHENVTSIEFEAPSK